ncbi:DUF3019 domain-containing protein [Thaumasiovibrio subtropicus]|uniref:DUF3019 domain-containing protein n=1 Tax=Thaumasiovibrio subtropicus TaxID=1891207 RepID=UPI000B35CFE7|nr:DUF3019 domain-containing protein [Thaumasiovibrio subtropicus]
MFSRSLLSSFTLAACLTSPSASAHADPNEHSALQPEPSQCVVIRKGKECNATVQFTWHTSAVGNYCLLLHGTDTRLQCWENAKKGAYEHKFTHPITQTYVLIEALTEQIVATGTVEVSWVYETQRKKRRWRLF